MNATLRVFESRPLKTKTVIGLWTLTIESGVLAGLVLDGFIAEPIDPGGTFIVRSTRGGPTGIQEHTPIGQIILNAFTTGDWRQELDLELGTLRPLTGGVK